MSISAPPDLYGPEGALVALVAGVIILVRIAMILWKDHLRADEDDRAQRDAALAGWKAQVDATKELSEAIKTRAADDAQRSRRSDGPR
jgi:hypothetical protein